MNYKLSVANPSSRYIQVEATAENSEKKNIEIQPVYENETQVEKCEKRKNENDVLRMLSFFALFRF